MDSSVLVLARKPQIEMTSLDDVLEGEILLLKTDLQEEYHLPEHLR